MTGARAVLVVGLVSLMAGVPRSGLAAERADGAEPEEVSLPATLVTEGVLPATEAEATFTLARSRSERAYGIGLSSLQYAPVPWFSLKLAVPFGIRDPRDTPPTVAGIGDVTLMAKAAPLMLPGQQLALGGGLKLTFPTGSERRELGGMLAVAPFLAAGKGFGPVSLQADASYSWQLNRGPTIRGGEEGAESIRPPKEEQVAANLTMTWALLGWLGAILELNSVTLIEAGDPLKKRVQLYLTPGVSVEPAKGWNLRGGIQLPVTRARQFEYGMVVMLTRGF